MSERYNTADVEAQFHRLRRAFGKRHASDYQWRDPARLGAWDLDSAPGYGGWVIEEQVNDGGGISHPFTHERRNAREFCEWVFAAFEIMRQLEDAGRLATATEPSGEAFVDTCPHPRHLHIDESRIAGDPLRYVNHTHRKAGLLANATEPASPGHGHEAHRGAGKLVS